MSVRRLAILGIALLLAASAVVGIIIAIRSATIGTQAWDRAEIDGDEVQLDYIGSECQEDAWIDVDEQDDRVVLTVRARVDGGGCSDVGFPHSVSTTLEEPVRDRELIDGACLGNEWDDRPACRKPNEIVNVTR